MKHTDEHKHAGEHKHSGCCSGHGAEHKHAGHAQAEHKNEVCAKSDEKHSAEHKQFMQRAIDLSERASLIEKSGGVFGAVIVKDGKIIGEGYNQVMKHNDPTWHAEIQAIREACKKMGTTHLDGAVLYTSAECCPMCLCAAMWAHIDHIYYGATIQDSLKYGDFDDVDFLAEIRKDPKERKLQFSELMRPEAVEIWKKFSVMPDRARY